MEAAMRKLISTSLIAAGVIVICIAAFQEISTRYNQKKLIDEYNQYTEIMKNLEISEIEAEASAEPPDEDTDTAVTEAGSEPEIGRGSETNNSGAAQESKKPDLGKILAGKTISGLLEIPKIKVSSAILEGTDDSALKYTVGHYPGLGEIGQPGNYVLLGHRNYVYGHFFRNLDRLEVGDEVIITKDGKKYTYVIYEFFVVSPEEVWVLDKTEEPIVTMITCTPIGTYTDRLIVRGQLKVQE